MSQSDDNHGLYPVRIDIPPEIRLYVVQLLNQTLACTVDLRSQVKQACWNVKGHDLVLLHALFATMATELDAHTDLVAERLVVLGGVARGTVRTAATHSRLPEYPGALMDGDAHVRALTECFASYATALRADIAHATEVEDAGSAALYTDISRGVDTRLGFLEAYLHHDGVSTEPARHDGSQAACHNGRRAQ
jgi:starvation-inducible DNA-binding protein